MSLLPFRWLTWGWIFIPIIDRALAYRGAVDFDDLIQLAYEMLDALR